ncbi:MAG: hypothetical protein CMJ94_04185 [Planctomycetes bacterium]|nr:hypothetical protein [Planctomycetota bacterium]
MTAEPAWIGHLYLRPPGAPAATDVDSVALAWDGEEVAAVDQLALRILSPIAAMPTARRAEFRVMLAGSHRDWARETCQALGCASVIEWNGEQPASDPRYHRVLYGCEGATPSWEDLAPLVGLLREEGQLAVYGVPAAELPGLQSAFAEHGFSLRAAGTERDLGFLAGSVENPVQFKS